MLQNIHTGGLYMEVYFTVSATSWIIEQFTEKILIILTGVVSASPQFGLAMSYG